MIKKIKDKSSLLDGAIIFCLLLREFLNITGYDYLQKYEKFNLLEEIEKTHNSLFTQKFVCEYIPEFINDFLEIFLQLFNLDFYEINPKDKLREFCSNFCSWLHSNNLTNCKIVQLNEQIKI